MNATPPSVTVVVTTRNRREDLRACLASIQAQTLRPEIIVVDDASEDGTAAMVATACPDAILIEHREPHGYIRGRNEAARRASGDIIVSIDDDAVFTAPGILRETAAAFDDGRIGAVAIPYVDVHRGPELRQLAPGRDQVFVAALFIGTAHAVRREVFLRLGGYREHLVHQGEESDFCIRLLAAGFVVRLVVTDPIHHFESPKRDVRRMDLYGPRNALLFVYQNVPWPAAAWRLPMTAAGLLLWSLTPSRLWTRLGGLLVGVAAMRTCERAPVPVATYALWRRLRTADPPLTLAEISPALPGRAC